MELGGAPGDGSSAELSRARAEAITLTLNTRLLPQEGILFSLVRASPSSFHG